MTDYFISDPHLGHNSVLKFTLDSKLRKALKKLLSKLGITINSIPLRSFNSIEEHNMFIIDNINRVVKPSDKLYILGDTIFGKDNFKYLGLIKCKNMYLIAGNHDNYQTRAYLQYFHKVLGQVAYKHRIILSHIPVHPQQLRHRFNFCIHGHLHGSKLRDPRFINVSCEQVRYTPISFEELEKRMNKVKSLHIFIGKLHDFLNI